MSSFFVLVYNSGQTVRLNGPAILPAILDSLSSPDLVHTLQLDIYWGFINIQIDELSEGFLWTG